MGASLAPVFEPGFFTSPPVLVAVTVGGVVAVVSAVVGTFTVLRGQSFAGHALADVGSAGGSAALLAGVPTLSGFVVFNVLAAAVMELIGLRRPRGRDLATGVVLGASLGLAALFLYEDTVSSNTTGATVNVLFGSVFTLSPGLVPVVVALGAVSVALVVLLYRPLVLSSVSDELAAARGVRVRLVGAGYLLALALAVSLSAVTIGAILSTALLVGPAASALRVASRLATALVVAAATGVGATWLGILVAYDSVDWTGGSGWPVSFCIVATVFLVYAASGLPGRVRRARRPAGPRTVGPVVGSLARPEPDVEPGPPETTGEG
ncbi:MAG: metal ABC transporter permease [Actinomycetota bacterium]|nr:metal ABC transporter permease [Actinomycetota bacterium]